MAPRFSVLLPTHNRSDLLRLAVLSVLSQTDGDFELLVVGDGCTDNSAAVIANFNDPRIRWFDLPKVPFSGYANRNVVLRHAQGELIAYAQDDDLMLPDHLALIGEVMKPGIDWAYSRPLWVTTDGIIVPFGTNLQIPDELTQFLEGTNTIPSNCVVHRRDCLDRFGYWPEDIPYVADWRMWQKIIRGGSERIAYLPIPTTLHFSAEWKKSRHSGMPEVLTWLAIMASIKWWPSVLCHLIPGPGQEQHVLFEVLQRGGEKFVAALREATTAVLDRQGWDSVRRLVPRLAELESQLSNADAALELARAETASVRAQLSDALACAAEEISSLQARSDAELARAAEEISSLQALSHADHARIASLQAKVSAVVASRTWRAMEPMRRLRRFLREHVGI